MHHWFNLRNAQEIPSPALVIDAGRVEENIRRMVGMAGGPERLRPHIKTHKMAEVVSMQMRHGIRRFKCATIAEAELLGQCGVEDALLAYPLVGPNVGRMIELQRTFPNTRFSALADDLSAVDAASALATASGMKIELLVDLNIGQNRTGINPNRAAELYHRIAALPGLIPGGLHAYDGHLHQRDVGERSRACDAAYEPVQALREELRAKGLALPRVVAGGTPTFPMHARRVEVECSPGTCIFWDAGYSAAMPDLAFEVAAVLLARIISKPGEDRICLDLGHKAVASEMQPPRVVFPELPDAVAVAHNEEHLVLKTTKAKSCALGDVVYGIPWHICPTVALHQEVWVAEAGMARTRWAVVARSRRITI